MQHANPGRKVNELHQRHHLSVHAVSQSSPRSCEKSCNLTKVEISPPGYFEGFNIFLVLGVYAFAVVFTVVFYYLTKWLNKDTGERILVPNPGPAAEAKID
jgi:hypothetical protein